MAVCIGKIHALEVTFSLTGAQSLRALCGILWLKTSNWVRIIDGSRCRPYRSSLGRRTLTMCCCPVRVFRRYLEVTKSYRRLFLPLSTRSRAEVTKNTMAFWPHATILQADQHAGLDPAQTHNPHEIRAFASTIVLHTNVR